MAKVCSNTLGRVRVSATVRSDLSEVWATHRTVPSGENANFHMGVSRELTRLFFRGRYSVLLEKPPNENTVVGRAAPNKKSLPI